MTASDAPPPARPADEAADDGSGRSCLRTAFLLLAIGGVVAAVAAGVGGWWVQSRVHAVPDFYTEAEVPDDPAVLERQAAEVRELAEQYFESPTTQPAADDAADTDEEETASAAGVAPMLELTEPQLNAWLASQIDPMNRAVGKRAELSEARIRLAENEAMFGVRIVSERFDGVLSLVAEPVVDSPTRLVLLVDRVRIGRLTVPTATILRQIGFDPAKLPPGVAVDLTGPEVRIELDWTERTDASLRIDELTIDPERVRMRARRETLSPA